MGCPQSKPKTETETKKIEEAETATPQEEGGDEKEVKETVIEKSVDKEDEEEIKEEGEDGENAKEEKEEPTEDKTEEEEKEDVKEEITDTNEEEEKTIVVFGATGVQGGSVARALLQNPKYKVKAVTRNQESDKAKLLAKEGAELVSADLDDAATLASVLQGAYGAFIVTNYWEFLDKDKEIKQGRAVADACKEAGLKHVVYSGLDPCKKLADIEVAHFDGKAEVEDYFQEIGVPFTSTRYSFYCENLLTMLKPAKQEDGTFALYIPMGDKPLAVLYAGGAGECIHQIFNKPDDYIGKIVGLASDEKTVCEIAEIMSKVAGDKTVVDGGLTSEQMAAQGWPGAAEMAAMFDFYVTGKCERSVEETKKLDPSIPDLQSWLDDNKDALIELLK